MPFLGQRFSQVSFRGWYWWLKFNFPFSGKFILYSEDCNFFVPLRTENFNPFPRGFSGLPLKFFILIHYLSLFLGDFAVDHGPTLSWPQVSQTGQSKAFLVPRMLDFCRSLCTSYLQAFPFIFKLLIMSRLGMCWSLALQWLWRGWSWASKISWMVAFKLGVARLRPSRTTFWASIRMGKKWTLESTSSAGQAFMNWPSHGWLPGKTLPMWCNVIVLIFCYSPVFLWRCFLHSDSPCLQR